MSAGRIAWTIAALLSLSAVVRAGAVLELVPSNAGPYFGGESLTVDAWLRSDLDQDVDLRAIGFDFQDTHPALALDQEFEFDSVFYTTPPLPGLYYTIFPTLPSPRAAFQPLIGLPPGWLVQLPATDPLHVGSIGVQLPEAVGVYAIDALNADEMDFHLGGASLVVGGGTTWSVRNGKLSGRRLEFQVVPEPATVVLIVGGVVILVRKPDHNPLCKLRFRVHRCRSESPSEALWDHQRPLVRGVAARRASDRR